ncbi:MAG: MAPEG family protein [Rhizobiales bacterium TMED168]|nr:MAG: MAPEG family protein [Rhizobiales bacterium TMED168]|tara:strand:- start:10856 stop:11236 length:381 start_codon:yes stop_codon:yes gene_type:complete
MIDIILLTLLFYFIQLPLPLILGLREVPLSYNLSSRDKEVKIPVVSGRGIRALKNLKESLFVFIPVSILSIITDVDVVMAATIWLVLRVVYTFLYYFGISYLRSIIWFLSVICLFDMAIRIFKHAI